MEGLLIIDKPAGPTSHDVVDHVRRASGVRRVGHSGTLDPAATGVLLVAVGRTTRLLEYLVGLPKHYEATVRLGEMRTTYDREGEVTATAAVPPLDQAAIETVLARFRGEIEQVPPVFSAIKQGGQPLHRLARRGEAVEPPPRRVTIDHLAARRWETPDLELAITCSSGTYIRSLAHDIGRALGCGGYLAALRRTAVGSFTVADAAPVETVRADNIDVLLRPPAAAVAHLPRLAVGAEAQAALLHGRQVPRQPEEPAATGPHVAFGPDDRLVGIVRLEEDAWRPVKMFPD